MDEQNTKASLPNSIPRSLFVFMVLIVLLMLILNVHRIEYDSFSGSVSNFKSIPVPKLYSSAKDLLKLRMHPWILRLLNCGYQNESFTPAERAEGMFLLKMTEWPNPPRAHTPFMTSTDPSRSHFLILNSQNTFHVGDQLQVMVHMYDFSGHPKQYGGDYLQARIHTPELKAGSVGTVVDYQNGSYKINFTLFWSGKVEVSVTLVHPSEAIQVHKRLREERLDMVYFKSTFKSGATTETTTCNLCLPETAPLCNFTDLKTGEPWFCYKPKKLPCTARVNHAKAGYQKGLLIGEEGRYFRSNLNLQKPILHSGPGFVTVIDSSHTEAVLGYCIHGKPLTSPSGFYYKDLWISTTCNIRRFNTPASITDCLRGKIVYLFGDSTVRQWFEYLTEYLPDLKQFDLGNPKNIGPHLSVDVENQIMVEFHCHGPPIRFSTVSSQHLHYIANALDELKGGKNTIIAITIWSHFSTFPVEVYIRRLQNIRRSILQLLSRSPDTQIVIKTANAQSITPEGSIFNNDWTCFQLDLVLRKMFKAINVAFVDAWEMTIAHYLPHELHPQPIIIKNEIDVFLSYVCPLK
ncbi:NXPE family member 3 [Callorhinchus milii]|uniref:Neurexophilin and PC-esterase domain family, member 3 n=1 Tax=Callorhinchus milii TaxID=7868 RepID=A0A4W3K766_CALMI|nr:NXPE family member 3 [Callorhinchus milii]|eukprot:gi/632956446/ref/XP_007893962.1/ PREDICTED: NXPE family member 3-like [Callorhinchus milii]